MELTAKHRELIVETWISLGRVPVTTTILRRIQRALAKRLGKHAPASPASIARVLVDEGAELRHPDVIECDVHWRDRRLRKSAFYARDDQNEPLSLARAEVMLKRFESLRRELTTKNDADELRRLREAALNQKMKAQLLARDRSLSDAMRKVQEEIAEWLRVWLQTPQIFGDWLDLRRRSPQFRETFEAHKTSMD